MPVTTSLPGGITATTTGRSIALTGATYPVKDQIKTAGFRWKPDTKAWTGSKVALERLTETLATIPAHGATGGAPACRKPAFPPTSEQEAILAAVATGRNVAVHAGAGTGKTSTMQLIAGAHPDKQILFVVFNRAARIDAEAKMPRNTECRTFDSLGWTGAPPESVAKFKAQSDADWRSPQAPVRRLPDVADLLDIRPVTVPVQVLIDGRKDIQPRAVSAEKMARLALDAVDSWCYSADRELKARHIRDDPKPTPELSEAILPYARKAWADILSPTGRLKVSNTHLTKLWALTGPDLTAPGSGPRMRPDMLIVDEAQDTNPVCLDVIRGQHIQTIMVGDSNQTIYSFRGCVDALAEIDVEHRLPLTRSWRFGPEIADAGNLFLERLASPMRIEGAGRPGAVLPAGTMANPDAVLCRTNIGMIVEVIGVQESGATAAVPPGTRGDLECLLDSVRWLQAGGRNADAPHRVHEHLAGYTSWAAVEKAIEDDVATQQTELVHKIVQRFGVPALAAAVAGLVEDTGRRREPGTVTVTTTHKVKGMEWGRVRVGQDFPQPRKAPDGTMADPAAEELRLAYVTVTRAKVELDPGSLAWVYGIDDEDGDDE